MKPIPEYYTLTIARTGKPPLVLSFRTTLKTVVLLLGTLAMGAGATAGYRVWQRHQASQDALDRRAEQILQKVEGLESEVDRLRARSGISDPSADTHADPRDARTDDDDLGRGGLVERPLTANELLARADTHATQLSRELSDRVEPALEDTLAYENALPQGLPLQVQTEITSKFGKRPNPFGYGGQEFHNGTDFAGDIGDPILATATGTVSETGWNNGYGQYVEIDHGYGYKTLYAHLSEISVDRGDNLDRGDVVGLVGNTGRSTAPHLHYSVFKDGEAIDPQPFLVRRSGSLRAYVPTVEAD